VLVYKIFVLRNYTISYYFGASLQLYNLLGDCARELFKPSKDVVNLLDFIEKNWKVLHFFCG